MVFKFFERPNSPQTTGSPPSVTTHWTATGTASESFVRSYALGATPNFYSTVHGTLYRQDLRIDPAGHQLWRISVPYGTRKSEVGSYRLSFDTSGGTVRISASKQTVNSYPAGTAPDHKNLIGVNGDQVAGTDIVIPALKITVHFKHPLGVITLPQIKALSSVTGQVNSTVFLTFAPGEVLFLGASGSEGTDAETETAYQFAMSANRTGLTIGDIGSIAKKGWEVAWISYKDTTDNPGGTVLPVKQPEFVYVERVYDTTDLGAALGFGGA